MEKIARLNNLILTKLKVKSINDVAIPDRSSNNFRGDAIRKVTVYFFDVTHDEMMETIYSWEELHYDELILVG